MGDIAHSEETESWLATRRRPGNWTAIAPDDEIPSDIVGWERTMLHMFQLKITPEIERRFASSELDEGFVLDAAQWMQWEDQRQVVRLNREVRGVALIKANRPIVAGDTIFASDLDQFVSFDLEENEIDAGHFTLLWTGSGWRAAFDFRVGRAKSAQMIERAEQFLAAAKGAAERDHAAPSVDNLFSACELASKAQLILYRNPAAKSKTHQAVGSAINRWGRLGNVDSEFLTLFNRMSNSRSSARYDFAAEVQLPSTSDFDIVARELERLRKGVAHLRHAGKDDSL